MTRNMMIRNQVMLNINPSVLNCETHFPILSMRNKPLVKAVFPNAATNNKIRGIRIRLAKSMGSIFRGSFPARERRSEEHTSELQSRGHLVCRLLLEKKKEEWRSAKS